MAAGLVGKVALAAGGSRGIGRAVALRFARAGAQFVVASCREAGAETEAEESRQLGGPVPGVAAPVEDEEAIKCLVEKALAALGRLGILVNHAARHASLRPSIWGSREAGKAGAGC